MCLALHAGGRSELGEGCHIHRDALWRGCAIGQGGGTYAKTLCLNGIAAVGWGPGDDNAFHVANEYVEIKQLVDFALMTCLLAVDLLV